MAVATILPVLVIYLIARCSGEGTHSSYRRDGNVATHFGGLLKPPPPPPGSNLQPVPFHGGAGRLQRQNSDVGYQYQPPPPPPPPPIPSSSKFQFPAPFYKQYNFNFVPPPSPFTTTPAPSSLFQKVSTWLFPSQNSYEDSSQAKKGCNPCNQAPWIPVIRYDLTGKNLQQHVLPTYGPPSATASDQDISQFQAQSFRPLNTQFQLHDTLQNSYQSTISPLSTPSSTYGPPSATHVVDISSHNPLSSTYSQPISSYGVPSSSSGVPSSSYGVPSSSYGVPSSGYGVQSSSFSAPSSSYGAPSSSYGVASFSYTAPSSNYGSPSSTYNEQISSYGPSSSTYNQPISSYGPPSSTYNAPSSTYGPPSSTYVTPSPLYGVPSPTSSSFTPATLSYDASIPNYQPPQVENGIPFDSRPQSELQLPKVASPIGFKNSYGEPITNGYAYGIPYPVSASAAESSKVKTEMLPQNGFKLENYNASFGLSKPAPFTLSKGRNIHTLQPVALPNLSVSPLPPIFNARPFRPLNDQKFQKNSLNHLINSMQHSGNHIKIEHSIPIAEFTQSVDYPTTYIQAPVIDIHPSRSPNQTKAFRNIPNSYIIDQNRDIVSQASEDHVSATKTDHAVHESSFESTGPEAGNDIYDIPSDLKFNNRVPPNHKENFADLRGVTDEELDKYRTDGNLQSIDSPLLYLKPSAPHKGFDLFSSISTTPSAGYDYEMYDDLGTTAFPHITQSQSAWQESRNEYKEEISVPKVTQEDKPKIVQIIIPYTTGNHDGLSDNGYQRNPSEWVPASEEEYQGRKIPSNTENNYQVNTVTEGYSTESTTTEDPTVTEIYDSEKLNTQAILNDLYDVREPPFDIIKLQHNIDDWTQQEFSHYRTTQKSRGSGKYAHAKQIPDEYFTTVSPVTSYVTANNYDFYDHEASSSVYHPIAQNKVNITFHKEYQTIQRSRGKAGSGTNKISDDGFKPHIYTAASSFRGTSTTPAPWGAIQTSISPLTKEKVYVVTSKPWRGTPNATDWFGAEVFESKKTAFSDNDVSESDNLPFKSPRFKNRPSVGFTSSASDESVKSDSSYGFSKMWHQSINDLDTQALSSSNATTTYPEGSQENINTNLDEESIETTTVEPPNES